MPKKKITIDDLAGMVQRGFLDLGQTLGQKIDNVEFKVETLRTEMHDEFRRIHEEINDIKKRLDQLSERTDEDTKATNSEILKLKKRIELLEKQFRVLRTTRA